MSGKKSRLYNIWVNMRQRCKADGKPYHDNWGNRGIKVCPEWNEYKVFEEWALGTGYKDSLTIDRIDVNGNYEPSNCRWATYKEQANNKRNNRIITINGESKSLKQWCDCIGNVTPETVYRRMKNEGWDIVTALYHPTQKSQSLHPDKTEELYARKRKPLVAYNEVETIYFASSKEAERQGHCRGAIRKARIKGQKHHGYYWRFADE